MEYKEKIVIIDGTRSPWGKVGGMLKNMQADDLGANILKELVIRNNLQAQDIAEVIIGNVASPGHAANIARVIALKAGIDQKIPAFSVHRNCASGMESVSNAISKIRAGEGKLYLVGGTESMSNIPLIYNKEAVEFYTKLSRAKNIMGLLKILTTVRPRFFKPVVGLMQGLTDTVTGLIMGDTAEIIAKTLGITRDEQDSFAADSHNKAQYAIENKLLNSEITAVAGSKGNLYYVDEGVRHNQTIAKLGKLKPFFDKKYGTVTAGNSSQITDGAAMLIVTTASKAKELGIKPMAEIKGFKYMGCDPKTMGLGPVYSTYGLLKDLGMNMKDIDIIELNEAFAAQVIGCERIFASKILQKKYLGESSNILKEIDRKKLNINGGAIALGHPVGATGTRLLITATRLLKLHKKETALATLCIGGGQGVSFILENIE